MEALTCLAPRLLVLLATVSVVLAALSVSFGYPGNEYCMPAQPAASSPCGVDMGTPEAYPGCLQANFDDVDCMPDPLNPSPCESCTDTAHAFPAVCITMYYSGQTCGGFTGEEQCGKKYTSVCTPNYSIPACICDFRYRVETQFNCFFLKCTP